MNELKILEVQDCFYPSVDGPVEVMISLARTFEKNGYGKVELLVPAYPEKVEVDGVTVHRCKSASTRGGYRAALPFFDRSVKKLIKGGNFDLIHLHSPFTLSRYALRLGKKCGIPVLITVHTKFRDEVYALVKSKGLRKFVMNYILKCIDGCDGIASVCKGMIDTLKEYGSRRVGDVKVVYNGTDMPEGAADPEKVKALREKYAPDGETLFIFAGRLVKAKNIQFSLDALGEVKKRGLNNFKFIIVGEGVYGKTLKKQAESLGVADNVVFIGKITDKNLLAEHFAASDVMLFPSVFDNASIALLEGAANGLPAATVEGSCSAERIENGKNGFAWKYDKGVWADEISALLQEPERIRIAKEGAKDTFYIDWNAATGEYLEIYKNLISRAKSANDGE